MASRNPNITFKYVAESVNLTVVLSPSTAAPILIVDFPLPTVANISSIPMTKFKSKSNVVMSAVAVVVCPPAVTDFVSHQ